MHDTPNEQGAEMEQKPNPTGWSKAAKRRRARRFGNTVDLTGQAKVTGPGYAVLTDADGNAEAQIWDNS